MQGNGVKAFLLQVIGQTITLNLGAGKHDGLVDGGVTQPVVQQLALVVGVVGPEQYLLDVGVLLSGAVNGDALGFAHDAGSQLLDARRKRGAEHPGLLAANGELVDFGQVVGETEVQHTVGFVHHQELHLVQLDLHGALQVEQAAWGCHHQIGILQLGNLQLVRHTAHDVGDAQAAAMLHQVDGIVGHLLGQFTGWTDDQCTRRWSLEVAHIGRVLALSALRWRLATCCGFGHFALKSSTFVDFGLRQLLEQGMQDRQQEGRSFATTSLAGDHQVDVFFGLLVSAIAGQCQGNGFKLNGGRLGIAQVLDSMDQLRRQAQGHKAVGGLGQVSYFGQITVVRLRVCDN